MKSGILSQAQKVTTLLSEFMTRKDGQKWYLNTLPEGGDPEQYLTNIAWTPDDRFVMIAVVNRAQNLMKLNLYDAASGAFVRTLFEESSDRWVEPPKSPPFSYRVTTASSSGKVSAMDIITCTCATCRAK
jgi:hypothetical protein